MRRGAEIALGMLDGRRLWKVGRLLVGLACSLALGWFTVRGMDWAAVGETFRSYPVKYVLLGLGLLLGDSFLRAYRWQVMFIERTPPLMRLFLVQNIGIGFNNLLPFRVFSEAIQFALLTYRYKIRGRITLATLAMERLLDLLASTSILLVCLGLNRGVLPDWPYVAVMASVAILSIVSVRYIGWFSRWSLLRRIPGLTTFAMALAAVGKAKARLSYAFLLTVLYWLLVGLLAWLIAIGMDLGVSVGVAIIAILGTLYFATALPSLPGAAGTFEFAVVYVLEVFEVTRAKAFSYGLIMHAILFLPPTLIALAAIPQIGLKSLGVGSMMRAGNEYVSVDNVKEREQSPGF